MVWQEGAGGAEWGSVLLEGAHVVAEGVELHCHSGEVELMEGGDVAAEGGFGSRFNLLVTEEVVDARCTFGNK